LKSIQRVLVVPWSMAAIYLVIGNILQKV